MSKRKVVSIEFAAPTFLQGMEIEDGKLHLVLNAPDAAHAKKSRGFLKDSRNEQFGEDNPVHIRPDNTSRIDLDYNFQGRHAIELVKVAHALSNAGIANAHPGNMLQAGGELGMDELSKDSGKAAAELTRRGGKSSGGGRSGSR